MRPMIAPNARIPIARTSPKRLPGIIKWLAIMKKAFLNAYPKAEKPPKKRYEAIATGMHHKKAKFSASTAKPMIATIGAAIAKTSAIIFLTVHVIIQSSLFN
jgi:hypothetical protein